jgi:hypothetical protein
VKNRTITLRTIGLFVFRIKFGAAQRENRPVALQAPAALRESASLSAGGNDYFWEHDLSSRRTTAVMAIRSEDFVSVRR